jgi:hypothetical protein
MPVFGDLLLESFPDGTFQLSKQTVVWRFTVEQLKAEIEVLEKNLAEKKGLLDKIGGIV